MDGAVPPEYADGQALGGEAVDPKTLHHRLAQSLVRFVAKLGGREVRIDETRRLESGMEVVSLAVKTGSPQEPAFEVLPSEQLVVLFQDDTSPLVVPLRADFPATPHTFGLPVEAPTSGSIALCIDDRPWADACADYNGAEIVRRIYSWFRRAGTGQMDDEMQFRDPAFLPPADTVFMSSHLVQEMDAVDGPPLFLALTETEDDARVWAAREYDRAKPPPGEGRAWRPFLGLTLGIRVENLGAMWHPPRHLGHLNLAFSNVEFDLLEHLKGHVRRLLTDANSERIHQSHLLIRVLAHNVITDRIESFCLLAHQSIGEIGEALGLLWPPMDAAGGGYTLRIPEGEARPDQLEAVSLTPANLSLSFDRATAQTWAGREAVGGRVIAFGAGAIGCQVLDSLVREGAFSELVIADDDRLRPHNLARHILREDQVGALKAKVLASELHHIRPDIHPAYYAEQLSEGGMSEDLVGAITTSDLALDLTASVGASRILSDTEERGRGISAFYNPSGDAVVVMVEDQERHEDLAALEVRYYREVILNPALRHHLRAPSEAVVSSGQCRSVTSWISSSDAALLSAAAAGAIGRALRVPASHLMIGSLHPDGSLSIVTASVNPGMHEVAHQGWRIRCSGAVHQQLRELRATALPNETGGVLLGVVDHRRKRIEVSLGLPAPDDSYGTPRAFERGVRGLSEAVDEARGKVMHQITYLGEWHTHPDGAAADPSPVDRKQMDALASDLATEERPAVMIIVGADELRVSAREAVR
ncbi:ThiF family adenylyltransferase [Sulfitobacter faviae]|uniref:ThiF family adenylyltransferase n=1 Tax=Sulfitobacter faviae TaxID=1775881 RepID=UPI00398D5E99